MEKVDRLQELAQLLTDSQLGYGDVAGKFQDPGLASVAMALGNGRAPMIEEIGNELALSGEPTPAEGTTKGSLHRTWMEMKDRIAGHDDKALIAECEQGESFLLQRYDDAIADPALPAGIKPLLRRHRDRIFNDRERVRKLEQMTENSDG